MRWLFLVGLVVFTVVVIHYAWLKKDTQAESAARARAAKKKKAIERGKITYTPPAKNDKGIMKVA